MFIMEKLKTSQARLESAREWKRKNRERNKAINDARNAAVRANPIEWAKKLAVNRASAKRNHEKRREYDRARDPQKKRARCKVRDKIWHGLLQRQPCEVCGQKEAQAHHENYLAPLEVKWLCPTHHKEIHKNGNQ